MPTRFENELNVAVASVRAASRVCAAVQADLVDEQTLIKKDRSPVTVADFASQAVVCRMIGDVLPADPIVAEEDARQLREAPDKLRASVVEHVGAQIAGADEDQVLAWIDRGGAEPADGRYWTLDPIDGTKGFVRGEQYAVALALIENGRVLLGVLGCPGLACGQATGVLLSAVRDQGAAAASLSSANDAAQPVRVSDVSDGAAARFCESVESAHSDQSRSVAIAKRLGITGEPVRMDSQAKYAAVARGDATIYMRLPTRADYRECIWDHAAGAIVVEEAGGRVSDIDGKPLDFGRGRRLEDNRGVVATNGLMHDRVIEAIAAAG